eukprot:3096211-Lingulodinium_polyedra.AAC.1
MSACALETNYLNQLEQMMGAADFRKEANMKELRSIALSTPLPTSPALREVLQSYPVWSRGQPDMPAWAGE